MSRRQGLFLAALIGSAVGFLVFWLSDSLPIRPVAPHPRPASEAPVPWFSLGAFPVIVPAPVRNATRPDDECEAMRAYWSARPNLELNLVADTLSDSDHASGLDEDTRSGLLAGALATQRSDELEAYSHGSDPSLRFRKALVLANLWSHLGDSLESEASGQAEGVAILRELEAEDPRNGAYPYFLAAALNLAGGSSLEVDAALRRALTAPLFDTHVLPFTQSLWASGLASPSSYALATAVLAGVPIPNYFGPNRLLLERLQSDDGAAWADATVGFGERLMDAENLAAPGGREGVHWFALEHAIGRRLIREAWPRSSREGPIPYEYAESYRRFFDLEKIRKDSETVMAFLHGSGRCPAAYLEEQLTQARELQNLRRSSASGP